MSFEVSSLLNCAGDEADLPKNGLPSSSPNLIVPNASEKPHFVTIFVAIPVATSISLDAPVVMPWSPLMIFSAILPPNNVAILPKRYSLLCIYVSSSGRNIVTPRALPLGIIVTL